MTDKEIIERWLKGRLADLYEESQCELPELPKEVIEGKMLALREMLSFIDSLQEEPVSEELEYFALQYAGHHAPYDDCMQEVEDAIKAGAKWQKEKDESTTEDLDEYINELSKQFPEVSFAKLSRIAVRVAKWQKQQDQSTIELAEDHAMLAGMEKMKEEMMANAIDVEVKVDAGGYPYIPQMELYNYDKDIPLAKEGDKYKVVLIRED